MTETDDLTVLRCHSCARQLQDGHWCAKCQATRSIFWVNGRSYPYTPEGERRAKAALNIHQRATEAPFFECPDCGGDLAGTGHAAGCQRAELTQQQHGEP